MALLNRLWELEDLEYRMFELYAAFRERYPDDPEAVGLFTTMSLDEIGHRDIVRFARRLLLQSPVAIESGPLEGSPVADVLAKVEMALVARGRLTLAQALQISISFEKDAAENYRRETFRDADPTVARLIASLSRDERGHTAILRAFAARRGIALNS